MLAAGREELRSTIAEIIKKAVEENLVGASKAERWLKKLEGGLTLWEEWPKFYVGLNHGALEVRYQSTNPDSIEQVAQRLESVGLKRGVHFSVKPPEEGRYGYISILRDGLAYAGYLSVRGEGNQQELVARFVEYILQRAEDVCGDTEQCAVYEKVKEIIDEGKTWGSRKLEHIKAVVEVNGKTYVVKVTGGGADVEKSQSGKKLLRIKISVMAGGVVREYTITYSRRGAGNAAVGYTVVRANALEDREADVKILVAVIEALTGKRPRVYQRSDGGIEITYGREHLDGFMRYEELVGAILRWLEETSRR